MERDSKTANRDAYRREIALYIDAVQLATGWRDVETGKRAGDLVHTTIGRAKKARNTIGFPSLLTLELASGVPIPDTLRAAAINAQQPTRRAREPQDKIDAAAEGLSRSEREELLRRLQNELGRTG